MGRKSRENAETELDLVSIAGGPNGELCDKGEDIKNDMLQEENWPDSVKKRAKRRIMKNIILISMGFLFNFTSFIGLSRLQSTLHQDEGMGTITQAVLYAGLVFSCLFLPKITISKLGYKWSIVVCIIGYVVWMGANGIGRWWSMTPASILVGLCGGPLWTAQCSYFTSLAKRYAKIVGESDGVIISRFFGIFYMIVQMASIFGSIISSTALDQPVNGTMAPPSEEALAKCGIRDCPENNVTNVNLEKPNEVLVWTMVGVFMAVATAAVILISILMDKLPKELENEDMRVQNFRKEMPKLLMATIRHWRHLPQILLIPLNMYVGMEQAYFNVEWTKSYISCSQGIWMVGFATLPFGFVNVCTSFTTGWLVKHIGRIPIFLAGMCMDLTIHAIMYSWMPHPSQPSVLYIVSACWGFSDAVWQTQTNALYGSIFSTEPEAAFANYRMFESIGFIVAFAYSSELCTFTKTVVQTSMLLLGICGYLATEYKVRKARSSGGIFSRVKQTDSDRS